jgi:Mg-chelatase subunit ChlD
MDYVFLLDISGSMNDDQKLAVSRNSLEGVLSRGCRRRIGSR